MVDTRQSRIFTSGNATTLYVTVPADVVSDSQFPFDADDDVVVTIDDDRLLVTPAEDDSG